MQGGSRTSGHGVIALIYIRVMPFLDHPLFLVLMLLLHPLLLI